jgi:putative ABC transport system substrate-binding protein
MKRREFIAALGAATAWPLAARAQQQTMPVIGFLDSRSSDLMADRLTAFRNGLKDMGYVEGENAIIAYRWAENRIERLPELAADLVHRKVAVMISVGGPPVAFAAKAATTEIPTLFIVGEDPVALGLVSSLARPTGNLTGINILNGELVTKRLELLRELVPQAKRVAVLVSPADAVSTAATLPDVEASARTIGLKIRVFNADTSGEIDSAFEAMGREPTDALFVSATPFFTGRRVQVAQLAAFHRLPAAYALREAAEVGGLMSYGADIADAYRQLGVYAGRILKGAKPLDLPVVQAAKFEFVINVHTAKMLGLNVPPTLLSTADKVIE